MTERDRVPDPLETQIKHKELELQEARQTVQRLERELDDLKKQLTVTADE